MNGRELVRFNSLDTFDDDAGVRFTPVISLEGQPGYHCENINTGAQTYVYLNASSGSEGADDHAPNVFVYIGLDFDPSNDGAVHFYDLDGELE